MHDCIVKANVYTRQQQQQQQHQTSQTVYARHTAQLNYTPRSSTRAPYTFIAHTHTHTYCRRSLMYTAATTVKHGKAREKQTANATSLKHALQ